MVFNLLSIFSRKEKYPRVSNIHPVVLLILDGYGIAPPSEGNAISQAKTPNMDSYAKVFPHGEVIASGESVGLPANEVGNTEVGHLTLGAGRVIDQDLVRINKSIKDGTLYENVALLKMLDHVRKRNGAKIHIAGLVGGGNVHSSMSHFWALMEFCKRNRVNNLCLHLFTDGRDSPPQEGISVIEKIEAYLRDNKIGVIATVSGRYYAMDRDGRWDRTKFAYDAITLGKGVMARSASQGVKQSYLESKTDEFIMPTVVTRQDGTPVATVDNGDAFFFSNFRIDRPRQLSMAFVLPNFEMLREFRFGKDPERGGKKEGVVRFAAGTFKREKVVRNLFFATMTEYQEGLPVSAIAFPKITVQETLPEIISRHALAQMHMSESEKERFVTYYFRGQHEQPFPREESSIIPSPKVATYDLKPEMSVYGVLEEFKRKSNEGKYNFFVINFANADMVGHTGNIPAAIGAVEHLDKAVGELVNWTLALGGTVVITADHGNAEEMLSYPTTSFFITTEKGKVNTDHSNNPVPVIVVSEVFRGKAYTLRSGVCSDIAPTILHLLGVPKPVSMTGRSLLEEISGNAG